MESKFMEELSLWVSIPFGVIIFFVMYYDKIKLIISDIWLWLASFCSWFQKKAIKKNIEARADIVIKDFDSICPELTLPTMSVSWVKDKDIDSLFDVENNQTIVMMRYNRDNSQNVINATTAYVKKSLLPTARPYVEEKLMFAIDYSFILKFLERSEHHDILISKYVADNKAEVINNGNRISCIKSIDDVGLFSRVLLRELSVWGAKILGSRINESYSKESIDFVEFLYKIATRDYDDYTPLQFMGTDIKVGVLLVAKPETYLESGAAPYLRRIKEGFANGIRTYYLLARNEKIEILHDVYSELISSGNFELKNGPTEYKDKEGRSNMCYCLEVVEDGEISTTITELNMFLESNKKIEATVSKIREEQLWCYYKGIEILVPLANITTLNGVCLRDYYHKGTPIQMYVVDKDSRGRFIGSFLNTDSNPEKLINATYSIGKIIQCIVEYAEDEFIKARVKNDDIECIAFRRNLTFSHFQYLHHLFPIGSEHAFTIEDINFIKRTFEIKLTPLIDPWENLQFYVGQSIECKILQKMNTSYKTELQDGVLGIIPKSELSWFEEDPNAHKLNEVLNCKIKFINRERRVVILSGKPYENPYETFLSKLNQDSKVLMQVKEENAGGVCGIIEDKYRVFVPISECHIGKSFYKYSIGKMCPIDILNMREDGRCFIGSFKKYIDNPLKSLEVLTENHEVVTEYKIVNATNNRVVLKAIGRISRKCFDAVMFARELTDLCYTNQIDAIFTAIPQLPMCVSSIDYAKNNVILSHKEYVASYSSKDMLEYGIEYSACVIGTKGYNEKVIIVEEKWIHAILESEIEYKIGTRLSVLVASKSGMIPTFYEA